MNASRYRWIYLGLYETKGPRGDSREKGSQFRHNALGKFLAGSVIVINIFVICIFLSVFRSLLICLLLCFFGLNLCRNPLNEPVSSCLPYCPQDQKTTHVNRLQEYPRLTEYFTSSSLQLLDVLLNIIIHLNYHRGILRRFTSSFLGKPPFIAPDFLGWFHQNLFW